MKLKDLLKDYSIKGIKVAHIDYPDLWIELFFTDGNSWYGLDYAGYFHSISNEVNPGWFILDKPAGRE